MHKKLLTFLLAMMTSTLMAMCPETFLDLYVGAHSDSVSFQIPTYSGTDTYKLNNLEGFKASIGSQVALDHRWYLRALASYGWIFSGTFRQTSSTSDVVTSASTEGNIVNVEGAAGYSFYPLCNLSIAPTFGWAYDKTEIYTKGTVTGSVPTNYMKEKTQWGGPFIGGDLNYVFNCHWNLFAQYELHFASTRLKLWEPTTGGITMMGHIRNLFGNLGRIGIVYTTTCGWNIGLNASYKYYTGTKVGTITPNSVEGSYYKASLSNIELGQGELFLSSGYTF